jgi:hypothetical protein
MKALDGEAFSMAEAARTHDGEVILFLSTICLDSYDDLIRDTAMEFAKRGVVFVGVDSRNLETISGTR